MDYALKNIYNGKMSRLYIALQEGYLYRAFQPKYPPPGGNFRDLSGGGYLARNLIFNIDGKKILRKIFLLPPFQGKLRKKIEFSNFFRGGVFRVTFPKITFFADIRGGVFSRGGVFRLKRSVYILVYMWIVFNIFHIEKKIKGI